MHFFTTTAGIKIEIQPIDVVDLQLAQDAVKREFEESGSPLEPPTYEVDVLGGEKEYHPHNETTIEEGTEEEKEQWGLHQVALIRLGEETTQRTALVFLDGMIFDLPEDDTWIKRRKKLFGETVPEDEDELKLYYVNKVLLKTPADKEGLMLAIQKLSMTGAGDEAIQAMERLFRTTMDEARRDAIRELETFSEDRTESVVL